MRLQLSHLNLYMDYLLHGIKIGCLITWQNQNVKILGIGFHSEIDKRK